MGCKHNFVSSGYGNDLICTKCGYAAMRAVATMPVKESIQEPALREKNEDTIKHWNTCKGFLSM